MHDHRLIHASHFPSETVIPIQEYILDTFTVLLLLLNHDYLLTLASLGISHSNKYTFFLNFQHDERTTNVISSDLSLPCVLTLLLPTLFMYLLKTNLPSLPLAIAVDVFHKNVPCFTS